MRGLKTVIVPSDISSEVRRREEIRRNYLHFYGLEFIIIYTVVLCILVCVEVCVCVEGRTEGGKRGAEYLERRVSFSFFPAFFECGSCRRAAICVGVMLGQSIFGNDRRGEL